MHEQFGRYILLERIAIGGMAEIFRAKAPGLGGFEKVLAIKRLHPRYSQDADFIEMLIDEARITVELAHSNIGQIFDLGKVEDHYFIAMEYIEGRDLYRVMKRLRERHQQFPFDAAAYVAMECCAGLDYAHRKRDGRGRPLHIIHRDVSPQNVLISMEGDVKLVDFGIAKAALRAYETESGIIKGKFYYMSPEQARGEHLDHRTDIFSLGIVLYEMLTGDLLYKDDDEVTLLSKVRRADIAPPSTMRPDLPPALERIAMRALARDREDRYPSAQHMQRDLARYLRDTGAVFNKTRLGQIMRDMFVDEPVEHVEAEAVIRDRGDFGHDQRSVISVADFGEPESTEVDPGSLDSSVELHPSLASEMVELSTEDIELIEDRPTVDFGGVPDVYDAFDSIESGAAGLEDDLFGEDEPTRAFGDRRPARREPESVPFGDRPTPVPVAMDVGPVAQPVVRAIREPAPAPRAAARQPAPAPEPAVFNRQPTVIVPQEAPRKPAPVAAAPRSPRRGREVTPAAGTQPGPARLAWVTRERLLMASVLVAVIILAAVITSFIVDDPVTTAVAEDARGEVITITGAAAPATEAPVVAANANAATLLVRSTPPGANIKVDGAWLPERTPAQAIVPAGRAVELIVRLDNHDEYRTQVTVSPGETRTLNAALQERTGTITVESEPSQAEVSVDGVVVGRTPLTHPNVSMRRAVRVLIEKDGYEPHRATVDWGTGAEQVVKVELQALPVAPPVAVNLPEARPAPVARVAPRPTRRATRREPRAEPRPTRQPREPRTPRRPRATPRAADRGGDSPSRGGTGKLMVQSRRWGSVLINGRLVATETPLLNKPLPEGTYRVQVCFEGNRDDCSPARRVTVYADQTAKAIF